MSDNLAYRSLPSIEKLVTSPSLKEWEAQLSHPCRVRLAQEWIAELRARLKSGGKGPAPEEVEKGLAARYQEFRSLGMRKVINATGVLLHTNLGRAPLGGEVLRRMADSLDGYCSLEFDITRGERGSRGAVVERLIRVVCDTPAALVVNNCASALFFILHALARDKEVLLSRGELVQIGGGFRLPDICAASGAHLKEVGTTNITSARDYSKALSPNTAMLLQVHQSNFVIEGHTEAPALAELAEVAKSAKIPFVVDLGSGQLVDAGIDELTLENVQRAGANLICFSGDKLLGGPQAGLVIGDPDLIARMKESPLNRALRMGKTELFLLEQTLLQYAAGKPMPTQDRIAESADVIRLRAQKLIDSIRDKAPGASLREGQSSVGGGTTPSVGLPTWLVEMPGVDAEALARQLLKGRVPVVVRRENKRLSLDLRTVFPHEEAILRDCLLEALARL